MTNFNFTELDSLFRDNDFPAIENDARGIRFLKLRSMSRSETLEGFAGETGLNLQDVGKRDYFKFIFESAVTNEQINDYINRKYEEERAVRRNNEDYLIDQLNRMLCFDWGGSFGNSLEKNIVDNYVKKIQSYQQINEEIEGSLLNSLRGYTLNSWYNHWTSIIIEDIFKDHPRVFPTIGLVKKIDFFINDIPFDLKVTYFPEELLKNKLKARGYGNELTKLKGICRRLGIFIPTDMKDRELKLHLFQKVDEDRREEARIFIADLKEHKKAIIREAEANPAELKVWFYENQGEARFDASNRFFLVLTDESDLSNSWKLKRNKVFLSQKINEHLNNMAMDMDNLSTEFYWTKTRQTFTCLSDILFLKYEE